MQRIGLGGGCHWCTEAVFQSLKGVGSVRQGFVASDPPDDGWSEAVELEFDPQVIGLNDLLAVHLATHASTSDHKMRGKYRSAVYTFSDGQADQAATGIARIGTEDSVGFVTRVLPHRGFKASDPRFHNYCETDPDRPFCQVYIDPKLAKLRARFSSLLKRNADSP
jgi:peptide-methionine (S)-S-oxide reductase